MNYAEMNDFFINKAVAATFLEEWYDNGKCVIKCDDDDRSIFNPCNSWADAGPIIQAHQINLNSVSQGWVASDNGAHDCNYSVHENPLRAGMIVFLMMQEAK